MTLNINVQESNTPTIKLGGRLDTHTAPELDKTLDRLFAKQGITRLVFDLENLEYLSSAGIRCFVRARKALEPAGAKVAIVNPQPPVQKVLDIVKAIPPGGLFRSFAELDEYLDEMQRKVREGD
jgi:anti-anti-sigma factor